MKTKPAYEVNENIKIKYLIDDAPNRNEFKEAVKIKKIIQIFKEGLKSIKILYLKNHLMIKRNKKLETDFIFFNQNRICKICFQNMHLKM